MNCFASVSPSVILRKILGITEFRLQDLPAKSYYLARVVK
jgi:hypothetical protein